MKKILMYVAVSLLLSNAVASQTLTFLFRNAHVVSGPKLEYEVWIKSSDGTSRTGSILVYNNYNVVAFGTNVVASSAVTVTKNSAAFGPNYAMNPANDNTASRFAFSWTYTGAAGSGVIVPSTGDGVLAFTLQVNIVSLNQNAGLSFQQSLMNGEQYKDDEASIWPTVDVSDFIDPPLPIQLARFTGIVLGSGVVRLEWTTLSEINNYGFEVLRKRTDEPEYVTLPHSFVAGHGTTNEPHTYSFVDSTVLRGQWNYRLKQIDLDGGVHYTDPISVNVLTTVNELHLPAEFALKQNYPNPFNPSTTIHYEVPVAVSVTLTVYDITGREVATLVNENLQAGRYESTFDANGLASGVYFYKLQTSNFTDTKKLLLLR